MVGKQERFRVAIAGCHRMVTRRPGSHNFATALHTVPETEVVAIFDLGADTRTEFVDCWRDVWGDVPTYDDYPRMLEEVKPELLCIATRQTMHADQIELAVRAGVRGILCDKPLVTSLAEMDRVVSACEHAIERRPDSITRHPPARHSGTPSRLLHSRLKLLSPDELTGDLPMPYQQQAGSCLDRFETTPGQFRRTHCS